MHMHHWIVTYLFVVCSVFNKPLPKAIHSCCYLNIREHITVMSESSLSNLIKWSMCWHSSYLLYVSYTKVLILQEHLCIIFFASLTFGNKCNDSAIAIKTFLLINKKLSSIVFTVFSFIFPNSVLTEHQPRTAQRIPVGLPTYIHHLPRHPGHFFSFWYWSLMFYHLPWASAPEKETEFNERTFSYHVGLYF